MKVVCSDLESIIFPEIWINVAKKTKISQLKLTTREVPDYHLLMKKRIEILKKNNIRLKDIQKIIQKIEPLKGAEKFLKWVRERFQLIILTDSFYEFLIPVIKRLNYPSVFCNSLKVNKEGFIVDCDIKKDLKLRTVNYLKSLGFETIAIGDSYNDIRMLKASDFGILFKPPSEIAQKFPNFFQTQSYSHLRAKLNQLK